MPQIVVRKNIPKAIVYPVKDIVIIKQRIPVIIAYDDKYIEPAVPYVDGGLYNQEGNIIDAGLYNTTSWELVLDGGAP